MVHPVPSTKPALAVRSLRPRHEPNAVPRRGLRGRRTHVVERQIQMTEVALERRVGESPEDGHRAAIADAVPRQVERVQHLVVFDRPAHAPPAVGISRATAAVSSASRRSLIGLLRRHC
jgi:hypothetical protein